MVRRETAMKRPVDRWLRCSRLQQSSEGVRRFTTSQDDRIYLFGRAQETLAHRQTDGSTEWPCGASLVFLCLCTDAVSGCVDIDSKEAPRGHSAAAIVLRRTETMSASYVVYIVQFDCRCFLVSFSLCLLIRNSAVTRSRQTAACGQS